jgi:hypothetical protein
VGSVIEGNKPTSRVQILNYLEDIIIKEEKGAPKSETFETPSSFLY